MRVATCNTAIDWAATGTMLQGWGTLIGAFAVIGAAVIGANTFNKWKEQKLAERKIELAERVLTATYKARRALQSVRAPVMWGHELKAATDKLREHPRWLAETDEGKKRVTKAQAYYERLHRTIDVQQELEECQPLAHAFFDEALEVEIEKLKHQFWMIETYVDAYASDREEDPDFTVEIRRALHASPTQTDDKISSDIISAVQTIQGTCLPILRDAGSEAKKTSVPHRQQSKCIKWKSPQIM